MSAVIENISIDKTAAGVPAIRVDMNNTASFGAPIDGGTFREVAGALFTIANHCIDLAKSEESVKHQGGE